ncbi:MAG: helix-turn-helix domain-containing protein [Thermoproteota archaeon]
MSLNLKSIKDILISEFSLSEEEVNAYLFMIEAKEFNHSTVARELKLDDGKASFILEKFMKMGLIIKGVNDKYKCLHPRMGLTNLYKIWEQDMLIMMRRKRAKVELLVRNLTSKYENK